MKRSRVSGQAMVETAGSFFLLIMMFFCIYYLFVLGINKIRALDTVHHLGRAYQVNPNPNSRSVIGWCYGGLNIGVPSAARPLPGAGPAIQEIAFQSSAMRVPLADAAYLERAWAGASPDRNR